MFYFRLYSIQSIDHLYVEINISFYFFLSNFSLIDISTNSKLDGIPSWPRLLASILALYDMFVL